MKAIHLIMVLLWACSSSLSAQGGYLTADDSDPGAIKLIEQMESYLESLDPMTAEFTIQVDVAMNDEDLFFKGSYYQQGNSYRIDTDEYIIYSNGSIRWMYDKAINEVSISNESADGGPVSPMDYLALYKYEDFVMRLVENTGPTVRQIELKPLDDFSDYSKLRLTVDQDNASPLLLETFEKNGDRINLIIDNLQKGDRKPMDWYEFNREDHPDVTVQDLRID